MGWRIGLLFGIAGMAVACSASVENERANLLARDREFSNVVKDIDKVLAFYVPDASLCLPGMPVATGVANIRSAAAKFAAVPGFSIEWEPAQVGLSASGDLGFTAGRYRMTTADKPITGEYLEVWKKSRGEWKVAEHFFHPDPN
jgi:ketosteroid isomerase-like protein